MVVIKTYDYTKNILLFFLYLLLKTKFFESVIYEKK